MTDRLVRLGALMRAARSDLGLSVVEAADKSGMSRSRWTEFESGRAASPRPQTLRNIERCLGWGAHSVQSFLDGGAEPVIEQQILSLSFPADREQLLADVRRELSRDEQGELRRRLLQAIVEMDQQ